MTSKLAVALSDEPTCSRCCSTSTANPEEVDSRAIDAPSGTLSSGCTCRPRLNVLSNNASAKRNDVLDSFCPFQCIFHSKLKCVCHASNVWQACNPHCLHHCASIVKQHVMYSVHAQMPSGEHLGHYLRQIFTRVGCLKILRVQHGIAPVELLIYSVRGQAQHSNTWRIKS